MSDERNARWMTCSACRAPIGFGRKYWVCSVSTCNRSRTRLVFCSVSCWDTHLVVLRHREAWAVEEQAPQPQLQPQQRRETPMADEGEILVVVSKMKKYIKDKAGLNTSDAVSSVMSDRVRSLCDAAIAAAQADGRKTVLDRDIPAVAAPASAPEAPQP